MKRNQRNRARGSRRAAMMVLVAICLPLCIIMAAFAINVAWMQNSDLVKNYAPIRAHMKNLSGRAVKGATSISGAVKTMVVMTDGIHNLGPEPILFAQVAKNQDIVIHTITFSDDADIKRMADVAAATRGRHFSRTHGGSPQTHLQGNRRDTARVVDELASSEQ